MYIQILKPATLVSNCTNMQTDQRICCSHMRKGQLSHDTAQKLFAREGVI